MEKTKILNLLSIQSLHQLYEGEEGGILLILDKRQISENYIRLRVRDAEYQDAGVCDIKDNLDEVQVGEVRWFFKSIFVNTPGWRKALKPGKSVLVGKVEELNMEGLREAVDLPDHVTHPI